MMFSFFGHCCNMINPAVSTNSIVMYKRRNLVIPFSILSFATKKFKNYVFCPITGAVIFIKQALYFISMFFNLGNID